jgi:benzoyl-CoA-dihydrodiol lyase
VLELLDEALQRLPDELRQARWMLKEREEFLAKTQREADDLLEAARARSGERLDARAADAAGLVTMALDDIDFEEEIRIVLEERASLSPDALTGMEANHRFVGPETLETKIFGRLTAWQNWIFVRPNASGPEGALRRYGTGQRGSYDYRRV